MAILSRFLPSSWFHSDSSGTAEALVKDRNKTLADNTGKIDDIARLKEQLRICFETVKAANPTLAANLKTSEEPVSEKEMGKQLKILALATMTDLKSLGQDLEEVRKKREELAQLLEIWQKIEAYFDKALENGANAQTIDGKNIQDLTALRAMVQNVGALPSCRSGSTLL
jgi:hypothetical protein